MYRAILTETEIRCERYEMGQHGVDLSDADGRMVAFVPYQDLEALVNDEAYSHDDPGTM